MIARINSAAVIGVDASPVQVEADFVATVRLQDTLADPVMLRQIAARGPWKRQAVHPA